MEGLEKVSLEGNPKTRKNAFQLISCTARSAFVFCLCVISHSSAILEPTANLFQSKQLDVLAIANDIKRIVQLIKADRETPEITFKPIFDEATNISLELGFEISLPRIVARQIYRANQPATTAIEYFKISIYIPYLDSLVMALENRFSA